MFDRLEAQVAPIDDRDGHALREGLRQVPLPAVSTDFDERVLAAVRQPAPRRPWLLGWTSWSVLRPVLAGATCSLVATLAAGVWLLRLPSDMPGAHAKASVVAAAADREVEGLDSGTMLGSLFALRRAGGEERREPHRPGS